jgi:hypothetical protein
MGLYAEIVASESYRDAKLQTALDTLPDLLGSDTGAANLRFVDDEGSVHDRADVVLVSNNPYVLDSLGGVGTRERMDTGTLGRSRSRCAAPWRRGASSPSRLPARSAGAPRASSGRSPSAAPDRHDPDRHDPIRPVQ